jgi:D-arabinitol 4-dehydrogenase
MIAQGGRYTLETVSPAGERTYRSIAVHTEIVAFSDDLARLIAIGADPKTKIISMTVTEAGYFLTPDRALMTSASDIAADLAGGSPRTLYGALRAMLSARRRAGGGPITLLSCDNLSANGDRLFGGLAAFLAASGETALAAWCARNVTAPNAMVDRITPRPPADLSARVNQATGRFDACPVMAEAFRQWVIEERFIAGRPPLEQVGVTFVDDVHPYEDAKIRILNASHSLVAWAGALKRYDYIDQAVADPAIASIARAYITKAVIPALTPSPLDLKAYGRTTLERFGNPAIGDTVARVAGDSCAKIPGFITPTLSAAFATGAGATEAAMAAALCLLFMTRWAEDALPFAYQDQALDADEMRAIVASGDRLAAFCSLKRLWGGCAGQSDFIAAARTALTRAKAQLGV